MVMFTSTMNLRNMIMERTGEMEKFGIKVIRFTNEQVLYNQDIVIEQINEFITRLASPALLGAGDGRG